MNEKIYDDLDNLIKDIIESEAFIELKKMKKEIDIKYKDEINKFKNASNKYEEALKYGKYYRNMDLVKQNLVKAKEELYNINEVKRYKKLERELQTTLDEISNTLSSSISNKFELKRIIK